MTPDRQSWKGPDGPGPRCRHFLSACTREAGHARPKGLYKDGLDTCPTHGKFTFGEGDSHGSH